MLEKHAGGSVVVAPARAPVKCRVAAPLVWRAKGVSASGEEDGHEGGVRLRRLLRQGHESRDASLVGGAHERGPQRRHSDRGEEPLSG